MNTIRLADFRRDPIGFLRGIADSQGDVGCFRMAGGSFVLVNDPMLIGEVLLADSGRFGRGPGLLRTSPLLGNGLLTNDGPTHPERRRRLSPAFRPAPVSGYLPVMANAAARVIESWGDGVVVDIHAEMTQIALDVVARTLFEYDGVDRETARRVGRAVGDAVNALYDRLIPADVGTSASRRTRLRSAVATLNEMLDRLMGEGNGAGERTEEVRMLRDEAMTFFLAGHESVSNALAWTAYLLATHPDIQEKLAAELHRAWEEEPTPNPSLKGREQDMYLRAVISESLRLYPPAWMMSRSVREPFQLGGHSCSPGDIVVAAQCVTHRDSRYFSNPDRFHPERWLTDSPPPKFAYFPFGAGARACIGERFAIAELARTLAVLIRNCRLTPVPGAVVEALPAVTLRPRFGVPLLVRRRQ